MLAREEGCDVWGVKCLAKWSLLDVLGGVEGAGSESGEREGEVKPIGRLVPLGSPITGLVPVAYPRRVLQRTF